MKYTLSRLSEPAVSQKRCNRFGLSAKADNVFWTPSAGPESRARQQGFTIIELMVATLVFSTIMLVVTTGVLYFTRTYYASLNRSKVQNTARAITASISQGIQFTGTAVATTVNDSSGVTYFCTGGKIYIFRAGQQYSGGAAKQSDPGLYVVPETSGCGLVSDYSNVSAQQLLGKGMRIGNLTLTRIGTQLYSISLTVAYGDDDLLSSKTGSGMYCISQSGSQFCAVSTLNTTVQRRLQDGQLGS